MAGQVSGRSRSFLARVSRGLSGRYDPEFLIGCGSASAVFLARDWKRRRSVAVKVLLPEVADAIDGALFLDELRAGACVDHPNIVPVLDAGEAEGLPFVVTPFVAGESLQRRLGRECRLDLQTAVGVATQVGAALGAAHSRGIVHRDIKPAHILLGEDHVQVLDFGMAPALDHAGAATLNTLGVGLGTPAYMSPEQALEEEPLDPRSDQYSLACVVHEMLTGEPLFSARSARALLFTHSACEPPRIREFCPELPPAVEQVTLKALSKSPTARYSTVDEFSEALAEASRKREDDPAPSDTEDQESRSAAREALEYRYPKTVLEHLGWLTMAVLALGIALIVVAILINLWVLTPRTP